MEIMRRSRPSLRISTASRSMRSSSGVTSPRGRQPREVLDLLMDRGWPPVVGNADRLLLEVAEGKYAKTDEPAMAAWALARLRPEHLNYLRSLPLLLRRRIPEGGIFVLVHATPWSVEEIVPPDAPENVAN